MNDEYGIVYKITNNLNGKVYVGQTTSNLEDRVGQHVLNSTYKDGILYRAIRKYGWDNFSYQKIDEAKNQEELNNKEIFYISEYNSFCGVKNSHGYNATLGGEGTRGMSNNLTIEDIICIKKMLAETNHNMMDIAKMFNVSFNCIRGIYSGKSWQYIKVDGFKVNMDRDSFMSSKIKIEDVVKIKKMISSKKYKIKEIGEMFNISRKYVSAISSGKLYSYIKVEGFNETVDNIGENNGMSKLTKDDVIKIRELYNQGVRNYEIAEQFNIHQLHVSDICKGISWSHVKEGINHR